MTNRTNTAAWAVYPTAAGRHGAAPDHLMQRCLCQKDPLNWLLAVQYGVISRPQANLVGLSEGVVRHKIRPGGSWQRLLPGIYLTVTGSPTVNQLDMAAQLFAGGNSVITGLSALRRHGLKVLTDSAVDVLVPAACKRQSWGYVRIHRTRRPPATIVKQGEIRVAMTSRAVMDAALGATSIQDMRAIVAVGIQQDRCAPQFISAELGQSRLRNSARLRLVLAEIRAGIRSAPEGDLMDLIKASNLPEPLYNPGLYVGGKLLAVPDAWWEAVGVAAEVDSREYHFTQEDWEHTMQRGARMTAAGIRVLHFSPRQIRTQPAEVVGVIREALRKGARIPGLRTVPAGLLRG